MKSLVVFSRIGRPPKGPPDQGVTCAVLAAGHVGVLEVSEDLT